MLKKIAFYSFAAIFLGIIVMLLPLTLYIPILTSTTTQTLPTTKEDEKHYTSSMINETRNLSLSEAAQIYGRSDIIIESKEAAILFPLNILIPLILVISTGLITALIVKIVINRKIGIA